MAWLYKLSWSIMFVDVFSSGSCFDSFSRTSLMKIKFFAGIEESKIFNNRSCNLNGPTLLSREVIQMCSSWKYMAMMKELEVQTLAGPTEDGEFLILDLQLWNIRLKAWSKKNIVWREWNDEVQLWRNKNSEMFERVPYWQVPSGKWKEWNGEGKCPVSTKEKKKLRKNATAS